MLNFSLWALLPPLFSVCTASGLWLVAASGFTAQVRASPLPTKTERFTALNMFCLCSRNGSGSPYPPFISVTGQFPPASCIFSEVMNLTAFTAFIIGLLRYVQLKNRIDKAWLNTVSVVIFSIACVGMTIVGNFQLFTLWTIHMVGTEVAFGLGTLFCWMQSYITLRVNLNNEGKPTAIARFLLSASITLCIILKFSTPVRTTRWQQSATKVNSNYVKFGLEYLVVRMTQENVLQRVEERSSVVLLHPAFNTFSKMNSARCQWAVVMLFLVFISTFGIEFRHGHFSLLCAKAPDRSLAHRSNMGDSGNSLQSGEQVEPL
ncbi:transmembrane protein 150C [Xenentodon cancila]